jgi:hypothetical protein
MSIVIADPATRAPAIRDRDAVDQADRNRRPEPSRIWALLGALAYAGAFINPTGLVAAQRLAQIREEERRRGRW